MFLSSSMISVWKIVGNLHAILIFFSSRSPCWIRKALVSCGWDDDTRNEQRAFMYQLIIKTICIMLSAGEIKSRNYEHLFITFKRSLLSCCSSHKIEHNTTLLLDKQLVKNFMLFSSFIWFSIYSSMKSTLELHSIYKSVDVDGKIRRFLSVRKDLREFIGIKDSQLIFLCCWINLHTLSELKWNW